MEKIEFECLAGFAVAETLVEIKVCSHQRWEALIHRFSSCRIRNLSVVSRLVVFVVSCPMFLSIDP
jgi:hypothetical protein